MDSLDYDSDKTIIQESDVQSILDKYKDFKNDNIYFYSSDEDELAIAKVTSNKQSTTLKNINKINDMVNVISTDYNINNQIRCDLVIQKDCLDNGIPNVTTQHQLNKIRKADKKLEKLKENEMNKEETLFNKELKKAFVDATKSTKPDECIKYIIANIDIMLMDLYGYQIRQCLTTLKSNIEVKSQIIPKTVTWMRKTSSTVMDDNGKLKSHISFEDENHMLFFMDAEEVINFIVKQSLLTHIIRIQSAFPTKRISLCLYGMQNYFQISKKYKRNALKQDFEHAMTELQLMCSCCYRMIETPKELGDMIAQFTKAVAQMPYKLEKQEKYRQSEWYMTGDNKDCVRVDKQGNGLKRLWQQHLTSLPLVTLETAEAITNKYSSFIELRKAYENCVNNSEREKLLQELPIRRAAGPSTNVRNIGPELSRKISTLYNSLDPYAIL